MLQMMLCIGCQFHILHWWNIIHSDWSVKHP